MAVRSQKKPVDRNSCAFVTLQMEGQVECIALWDTVLHAEHLATFGMEYYQTAAYHAVNTACCLLIRKVCEIVCSMDDKPNASMLIVFHSVHIPSPRF